METGVIFIDLEKALDTVPVQKLFLILDETNISGYYKYTVKQIYLTKRPKYIMKIYCEHLKGWHRNISKILRNHLIKYT